MNFALHAIPDVWRVLIQVNPLRPSRVGIYQQADFKSTGASTSSGE